MTQVKAPYNFVPLNKKVFFPYWAQFVSQDIPFKNSRSGKIKLKIKAETPIFIRGEEEINSIKQTLNGEKLYQYRFKKLNNKYCIPGTSIKGEIESVLEILSFGKLKRVNDSKYSIRDFQNTDLYNKPSFASSYGGWLYKDSNGKYYIKYNSKKPKPGRITHQHIDTIYKTNFVKTFGESFNDKLDEFKAAKKKYDLVGISDLRKNFALEYNSSLREVYEVEPNSYLTGTIVFTGQSSRRKMIKDKNGKDKWVGKHLEFIFWESDTIIEVKDEVIQDFFFAYFDKDAKNQSIDWKYWKPKLNSKESIPVFFQLDENGEVKHLGLSMLYKLPYNYRVTELIKELPEHKNKELDFAEALFGYSANDQQKIAKYKGLKGRVSIEPALNTNKAEEVTEVVTTILGSPKASFYPFYIWQNPNTNTIIDGQYKTFMDSNSELAGRKRYPIRTKLPDRPNDEPSNITVSFIPLKKGAEFETTIHFHNLREIELGALLSAITFHNTHECRHSLGMAKPLGYGHVKFEIDYLKGTGFTKEDIPKLLGAFEKVMTDFQNDWINSDQINQLLCIATPLPVDHINDEYLKYLDLENFVDLKKEKKALLRYSDFVGINTKAKSLINNCVFDIENDKNLFIENRIQKEIVDYLILKREEISQKVEQQFEKINELDREREERRKADEKLEFQNNGIKSLLEQNSVKKLISKTNWWIGRFHTKENQNKIEEKKLEAIPEDYHVEYIELIQQLYDKKPNDRVWKKEKNKIYKYLTMCIGVEKTNKWFAKNNIS